MAFSLLDDSKLKKEKKWFISIIPRDPESPGKTSHCYQKQPSNETRTAKATKQLPYFKWRLYWAIFGSWYVLSPPIPTGFKRNITMEQKKRQFYLGGNKATFQTNTPNPSKTMIRHSNSFPKAVTCKHCYLSQEGFLQMSERYLKRACTKNKCISLAFIKNRSLFQKLLGLEMKTNTVFLKLWHREVTHREGKLIV